MHFISPFYVCCLQSPPQDLVLFPQLLTLPIKSRMGPRLMYARKRNIKLLQPGMAAAGSGSATGVRGGLQQLSMVPLDVWLGASDKELCKLCDVNMGDYLRWGAGTSWHVTIVTSCMRPPCQSQHSFSRPCYVLELLRPALSQRLVCMERSPPRRTHKLAHRHLHGWRALTFSSAWALLCT